MPSIIGAPHDEMLVICYNANRSVLVCRQYDNALRNTEAKSEDNAIVCMLLGDENIIRYIDKMNCYSKKIVKLKMEDVVMCRYMK